VSPDAQALVFIPKQNSRILEAGVMFDQQRLIVTLRNTSALLSAVRKSIAASGNLDAMQEIDTLLAVAQSETEATSQRLEQGVHPA
jgi:hypothetical protein